MIPMKIEIGACTETIRSKYEKVPIQTEERKLVELADLVFVVNKKLFIDKPVVILNFGQFQEFSCDSIKTYDDIARNESDFYRSEEAMDMLEIEDDDISLHEHHKTCGWKL